MKASSGRGLTALVFGLGWAAACGGQSASPQSGAGGATIGTAGAPATGGAASGHAGAGASGGARAGETSSGGQAGTAAPIGGDGNGGQTECSAGAAGCGSESIEDTVGTQLNEFGFAWRDAFMLLPCYSDQRFDCPTVPVGQTCPNLDAPNWQDRGLVLKETFQVGGEPGKLYKAHLVVNGVVSGKYYKEGLRDAGTEFAERSDAFYRGGSPVESSYDTWRVTVRRSSGEELAHYYLNSYPQASGLESHQTVLLSYEKDIEVPGGGSIEYRVQDPNCHTIDNCGPGDGVCFPRIVPNDPNLVLPQTWHGQPLASYDVVSRGEQPFHAQLVHLRVTSVSAIP